MSNNNEMVCSDFNLEKITTKQLHSHLKASIDMGSSVAVFGRRGLGKTHIAKQAIDEMGMHELYLNLSVMERPDFAGYVRVFNSDPQDKYVSFMQPVNFKPLLEGEKKVVVLFDEVDKADPSLCAPLLEFVQFGSINGLKFKNLQCCIMTGNLISEGGNRPSPPLLDRAEKYLLESTAKEWLDWSGQTGEIHPSVHQFIHDNPNDLVGPVDSGDNYSDRSPRGWHNASKIVYYGEQNNWSPDLITEKVSGYVGRKAGLAYKMYYSNYRVLLPMIDKVFAGEDYSKEWKSLTTPTDKLYSTTIVCSRLSSILDAHTIKDAPQKTISLVAKFLEKVDEEHAFICLRTNITMNRLLRYQLISHPDWKPFVNKIMDSFTSQG